jgi:plasmid rolling circle replication initiator protein Rep
VFYELSKVMDVTEQRNKDLVPIFLTLTVKNCTGDELSGEIDRVLKGWRNVNDHRKIRNMVKGWFRALEITYDGDKVIGTKRYEERKNEYDKQGIKVGDSNPNYDTFHPHVHAIMLVDKSYFTGKDYMQTTEWVQLWRTSAGLDYDPICDIRKVRRNKGKYKDVAEVAKYTLKDTEYIRRGDNELTDKLVNILDAALHRRRLYAYGGVLKEIAKELNINTQNPDDGDLVHIDDDAIREDIATVMEVYKWNFGAANYIKSRGVE